MLDQMWNEFEQIQVVRPKPLCSLLEYVCYPKLAEKATAHFITCILDRIASCEYTFYSTNHIMGSGLAGLLGRMPVQPLLFFAFSQTFCQKSQGERSKVALKSSDSNKKQ